MSKVKIAAARLSFPCLFTHSQFNGESTGKYEATFILDKVDHAKQIAEIQNIIANMMKTDLKTKLGSDKLCLKDGDEQGRPEYEGKMTIKASTKKRPVIINRDKSPVTEEDGVIYGGCYVNAVMSLWAQSNGYGKRINASLDGVQFVRDGDAFGEGAIGVSEFDAFDDDDDSDF